MAHRDVPRAVTVRNTTDRSPAGACGNTWKVYRTRTGKLSRGRVNAGVKGGGEIMTEKICVYLSDDVVAKIDETVAAMRRRYPALFSHANRQDAIKQLVYSGYEHLRDIGEIVKKQ